MRSDVDQKAQYEQVTATDGRGEALFRRLSDGCTACLKAAYFKPAKRGGGLIPSSGARKLKLEYNTDWAPADSGEKENA